MTSFTNSYISQQQNNGAARLQTAQAQAAEAEQLGQQATQDALWRMEQNNAMAKLRGFSSLAKSANDMS